MTLSLGPESVVFPKLAPLRGARGTALACGRCPRAGGYVGSHVWGSPGLGSPPWGTGGTPRYGPLLGGGTTQAVASGPQASLLTRPP